MVKHGVQEEYIEGEDMGALECGHDFHSQCIKEWLKQKNICPICKTTGLNTAKKRKIGWMREYSEENENPFFLYLVG